MFRLSEENGADSKLRSLEIMGKKVSQALMKISKKEKNQLSSLIKELRPKVYITDSSSFKRLVQELTGKGRTIPSPPPPSKPQTVLESVAVVNVEARGEPVSGMETSFDASVDSFEFRNQLVSSTEEPNQPFNHGQPDSSMVTSFDASVDSLEFCNQLVSFTGELNQPYNHGEPEISMETSLGASVDLFEFCNQLVSSTEELNQPYNHGELESSMETSFDASVDSFEFCNQLVSFTGEKIQRSESSMETSFDASVDSFEFCNQLVPFIEELNQPYNQLHFDDVSSNHLSINQQTYVLAGQDFESLLLDIEQHPFSSNYSQIH